MGLVQRLAGWFAFRPPSLYQCEDCGTYFERRDTSCPECGGEIDQREFSEELPRYWGPM